MSIWRLRSAPTRTIGRFRVRINVEGWLVVIGLIAHRASDLAHGLASGRDVVEIAHDAEFGRYTNLR
jgi:hypothetical protein